MHFKGALPILMMGLAWLNQPEMVAAACASSYSQCGGELYTGPTCCPTGWSCQTQNAYYAQCLSGTPSTTVGSGSSTGSPGSGGTPSSTTTTTPLTTQTAPYRTSTTFLSGAAEAAHTQAPYTDLECNNPDCGSGTIFPDVTSVGPDEAWHYSRSTHFGETSAGACGFGLYGLCTMATDSGISGINLGSQCQAFCTAYPLLCQDPTNVTLRGNFAAPNGDYYTQFWPMINSTNPRDNYLSCGECFELVRTYDNGTDYQPGEAGYAPPLVLEIVDSCPCEANQKWCCGPGVDQCQEVENIFTYGCPLPNGSIHLDLSDVAMTRAQAGTLTEGVIPTRYKRVPCPKPGNVYVWLRDNCGPYWIQITAVNAAGTGSIVGFEIRPAGSSQWMALIQEDDYNEGRPQERYGAWTLPPNAPPVNAPFGVRLTSATGEQIVNEMAISSFTPPASAIPGFWYIDMGIQFVLD